MTKAQERAAGLRHELNLYQRDARRKIVVSVPAPGERHAIRTGYLPVDTSCGIATLDEFEMESDTRAGRLSTGTPDPTGEQLRLEQKIENDLSWCSNKDGALDGFYLGFRRGCFPLLFVVSQAAASAASLSDESDSSQNDSNAARKRATARGLTL